MVRCIARALVWLIAMVLSSTGTAALAVTNQYTNSVSGAIDDLTCGGAPLIRTFNVTGNLIITDVDIGVALGHTFRADLDVTLTSPAGTVVSLMNFTAGDGDNLSDLFNDAAFQSITNHNSFSNDSVAAVPPYAHSFQPSSPLSAFNGQTSAGTWTLTICDGAVADTGTFTRSDLYITGTTFADLSLAMSLSNTAPAAGSTVTYTLTVANSASSIDPASVVVRDALPSGLSFVSATATAGSYNSSTGDWTVGSLGIGANASLTITAIVTASNGTSVTNTAEVYSSSVVDSDSTPNNGVNGEDDRATATFTANATRTAGSAPTLTCAAGTSVFDWDSVSWNAGATSNSYTLTGIGTVNFGITNPGVFLNDSALGGQSPTRQSVIAGGYSPAQFSLAQLVDMTNTSQVVTTTISLGTAAQGAQFRLFDVDYGAGQFADKVTVTGYLNGVAVIPTLTNGISNYVIGNSAFGDGTSSDPQANGNVVVTFTSPVDQIVIQYGNHSLAPSNPGAQAISIHDITLCRPVPNVNVTKMSTVLTDPVNGTTNPKAMPGASMRYCLTITNDGSSSASTIALSDSLPGNVSFVAGSMRSGTSCGGAATLEDDNAAGADESDPVGGSISGSTISGSAPSLNAGSSVVLTYTVTIN
ncbi:MAG: proprotein convertase P-domain-containing protein [Novosphingobium sp.]